MKIDKCLDDPCGAFVLFSSTIVSPALRASGGYTQKKGKGDFILNSPLSVNQSPVAFANPPTCKYIILQNSFLSFLKVLAYHSGGHSLTTR